MGIADAVAVAAPLKVIEAVEEGEPVATSVGLALKDFVPRGDTEVEEEAERAPLEVREGAAEAV